VEEILSAFIQIQQWPEFGTVEETLAEAIAAGLLLDGSGKDADEDWATVVEPVTLGEVTWTAKIYRHVRLAPLGSSEPAIPFTAMRLACPAAMKELFLAPESERGPAYVDAIAKYTAPFVEPAPEYMEFLVDLAQAIDSMYPDEKYLFVPSLKYVALMPHYDHDLVLFLISGSYLSAARQGS
jgi:hypothetical protein